MFGKVKRYIRNPYYALGNDMIQKCPHLMSDKFYLSVLWKMKMGYELDWKHPKTFNEKLQWLKLYDRKPIYTTMVDKYRVKQWVADKIGEQYVIPTLAVYDSVDEIDLDKLPDQFVLKCNHDSGSVAICRDKSTFDLDAAKRKLGEALKKNFYWEAREWPYKNVKRLVFAEKFLEDPVSDDMIDYKMMAFHGKVKCGFTCTNRRSDEGLHVTFYDTDWKKMPFERHYPAELNPIPKPVSYEQMVGFAERLSEFIPFSRVDFYEIKGKPYFGEITLYPGGGFEEFDPENWDETLGTWVFLPDSNVNNNKRVGVIVNDCFVIYVHLDSSKVPADYKFYCFNGEPKWFYITSDKGTDLPTREDFFDIEGNHIEVQDKHYLNNPSKIPALPTRLDDMLKICRVLAKDIAHLRVDFYEIAGKVYCGEMTFYENGGFCEFTPDKYNDIAGDWIELPNRDKLINICNGGGNAN